MPSDAASVRGRGGRIRRGSSGVRSPGERVFDSLWRFGLWLRRRAPLFQEERLLGRTLIRLRALYQIPLCVLREPGLRSLRKAWLCLRVAVRYTMVSPAVLFRMYDIAEATADAGVKGSVVECGVWNGGSAALLALAARCGCGDRDCWLFDSFRGLPRPSGRDPAPVRSHYFEGWNRGDESRVREIWGRLGLSSGQLHVQPGWFHDSFPRSAVDEIAILHIDSDWYDSIRLSLDWWYDKVQPGGVIILNDYNLYSGANEAVHDFLQARSERVEIFLLGRAGAWFVKPAARGRSRAASRQWSWGCPGGSVPRPLPSPPPAEGGETPAISWRRYGADEAGIAARDVEGADHTGRGEPLASG